MLIGANTDQTGIDLGRYGQGSKCGFNSKIAERQIDLCKM